MSLPSTYKKIVGVRSSNSLREAVEIQEVPLEAPGADEILVQVRYTGVNAADYLMAAGRYLASTPPPFDLGSESVGVVVAVGSEVNHIKEGDAVLAIGYGYREYFTLPAKHAIPIPEVSPEAITLGISGLTASIALNITGEMTSGETVLVTAAAGGTGSFAVQLAKLAGNHVIGTCGSDEKAAFLRSIGCDRPLNYRTENLRDVLRSEYAKGVDIVFDGVGGEMFDTAVNSLAVQGRLLVIGSISEYETGPQKVNQIRVSYKLINKSASVRGFWLMHFFRHTAEHMQKLLGLVGEGKLLLSVDDQHFQGVEGGLDALEYMYAGKNIGKVVVEFPA
ncbi:MAG: zinc-binding dehydrogenase [Anaerolineae bacterium]|nr:zinc-binding dehydrogenase [Anaerolineae bacterium]